MYIVYAPFENRNLHGTAAVQRLSPYQSHKTKTQWQAHDQIRFESSQSTRNTAEHSSLHSQTERQTFTAFEGTSANASLHIGNGNACKRAAALKAKRLNSCD